MLPCVQVVKILPCRALVPGSTTAASQIAGPVAKFRGSSAQRAAEVRTLLRRPMLHSLAKTTAPARIPLRSQTGTPAGCVSDCL
jgi:hypothetical protein